MSSAIKTDTPSAVATKATTVEEALEHAKRAFALKKYEQAIDHYATALELMTAKVGDEAPEVADLYFAYGKALLENAISQTSVLGKEQPEDPLAANKDDASKSGAFLSFSGDAEDTEDTPVDLFAEASKAAAEGEDEEDEDEDEEGEPEDDFNAAWEVLDLARALYEKRKDEEDEVMLKLAETYITLGDVSLETEKFDQAISDYTAGLQLKIELLPQSSRQIAEAHYKLSIVLDLSSDRQNEAIEHAEKALASVEARLAELRNVISGQVKIEPQAQDAKGKGKGPASGSRLPGEDSIRKMSKAQMESEIKELEGLKEDLGMKVDELRMMQNELKESAPVLAAKALDKELGTGQASSATVANAPVHDLTSIVKKKKKPAPEATSEANGSDTSAAGKRKAEDDGPSALSEKKAKLGGEGAQAS